MAISQHMTERLAALDPERPVLIAGPTASGKSALALAIAERQGGIIVNADAIQVYADWRILTARPSEADLSRAPHALYGHIPGTEPYSVGDWLRAVAPLLKGGARPIVIGGTGLYLTALTEGLADIPATPPDVRAEGERWLAEKGLAAMVAALDPETRAAIDTRNPARVARAWEVLTATGRGLRAWQTDSAPPLLPLPNAQPILVDGPKAWLTPRIARRFDAMLAEGALDEARRNRPDWSPKRPSAKAIGAAELMAYLDGRLSLDTVKERATALTRQFAKRQRTWFKARMGAWPSVTPEEMVP